MTTRVLLCAEGAPPVAYGLSGADLMSVPGLCGRLDEIGRLAAGADRLVLGLCGASNSRGAIQREARSIGLDALGVVIIDLREADGDPDRLAVLVWGAVARAAAFGGSRPQHAKLCVSQRQSRRSLFTRLEHHSVAVPDVERAECAARVGCRACVEACPRGALTWSKGAIEHDVDACDPCGRCVTACPTGAMVNAACTAEQLGAQVHALLAPTVGPPGSRGIVFTCESSVAPLTDPGWYPVRVPCTGMLTPAWLLAPLTMGAASVAARPCGDVGCHLSGDARLADAVAFCHSFLGEFHLPTSRVRTGTGEAPGAPMPACPLTDIFGPKGFADIVVHLAATAGMRTGVVLEDPRSPLGTVSIRPESCTMCTMCAQSCPTGALAYETTGDHIELTFEAGGCVACRQCLSRCPETGAGAITFAPVVDLDAIARGREVISEETVSRCVKCGAVIAPNRLLDRLRSMMGDVGQGTIDSMMTLCPDCRELVAPSAERVRTC